MAEESRHLDLVGVARRAVSAAEEAVQAAKDDPSTPSRIRALTARTLDEARNMLHAAENSPHTRQRQSFTEFASLLGEEVKEAAEESLHEGIQYAERTVRKAKSLVEDHFQIDEAFRMLGPLRQDANLARDVHDWFNLLALLPVVCVNLMNWSCAAAPMCGFLTFSSARDRWHGHYFMLFWLTTAVYFVVDLLWMLVLPHCVKSPGVIVKHHVATLLYMLVPYFHEPVCWFMGACMIVEVNTWFLIARRSFNKNGDKMFTPGVSLAKSLRLLVVSSCFYITWFGIRLIIYPALLVGVSVEWYELWGETGRFFNIMVVTPPMQCVFIFLNVKWTIDLFRSKFKGRRTSKGL